MIRQMTAAFSSSLISSNTETELFIYFTLLSRFYLILHVRTAVMYENNAHQIKPVLHKNRYTVKNREVNSGTFRLTDVLCSNLTVWILKNAVTASDPHPAARPGELIILGKSCLQNILK